MQPLLHSTGEFLHRGLWGSHWSSAGLSCPSHAVSQGSGIKGRLPPPPSLRSFSSLSLWTSVLASDPSWVLRTPLFPPISHTALTQHLGNKFWGSYFSVMSNSIIFVEVLFLFFKTGSHITLHSEKYLLYESLYRKQWTVIDNVFNCNFQKTEKGNSRGHFSPKNNSQLILFMPELMGEEHILWTKLLISYKDEDSDLCPSEEKGPIWGLRMGLPSRT